MGFKALLMPLLGWGCLVTEPADWAREETHPAAKKLLGPSPTLALLVVAAIGLLLSPLDLPEVSSLTVPIVWVALACRIRWSSKAIEYPTDELEREHLGRSVAVPLSLCIVVFCVGDTILKWPSNEPITTGGLLGLETFSIAMLLIPIIMLAKSVVKGAIDGLIILFIVNILISVSQAMKEPIEYLLARGLSALLSPLGLSIPDWFDSVTHLLYWTAIYCSLVGIGWLAARQTMQDQIAGDENADVVGRIKGLIYRSKRAL